MKISEPTLPQRIRAFTGLWTAMQGITALSVCLALLILLDAVLVLPAAFRQWTWPILLATLTVTVFPGIRRTTRMNNFLAARWVERRRPELGNLLSNAADFQSRQPGSEVESRLCYRAVDKAAELAREIRVWPLVRQTTSRMMKWTLGSLLILLAGGVILQAVVTAVWPRLFDPHGDHPQYSRLKLTVTPGNTRIIYGGRLDVRVQTAGRAVKQLNLVAESPHGAQVLPMFIAPDQTYFQNLTNITTDTTYYVTDGRARSHHYLAGVVYTPKIEAVQVHIRYPQYTRLPILETSLAAAPIKVPAGSHLSFRVTSNRELKGGEMRLTPILEGAETTIACTSTESGYTVACDVETNTAGLFKLAVMDMDGRRSREEWGGRIDILADQPPRIQVLQPQRQVVATPDSIIPVVIESADDYGVNRIFWFRGMNMSVETPGEMQLSALSKPDLARVETRIDLKDLGVRPGDVIHYFFETVDNDPSGPNLASSRMYNIEIISHATYEAILARLQAREEFLTIYETLSRRFHRLIQKMEELKTAKDENTDDGPTSLEDGLADIMERIEAYIKQLAATIAQPHQFDIEALFKDHLATQKEALELIVTDYQTRKDQESYDPMAFRDTTLRKLKELEVRSKTAIMDPLLKIKSVIRLLEMARQFEQLTANQANLVRLARRFATDAQPLRLNRIHRLELQELGNKEAAIAERVATFFQTLRRHLANLPDDKALYALRRSVDNFLYQAGWLPIDEDLTTAARDFTSLDGPKGYEYAMIALKNMEKLLTSCQGMTAAGQRGLQNLPLVGRTAIQILDVIGGGNMGFGHNGYSFFDKKIALYGPGSLPPQKENPSSGGFAKHFAAEGDDALQPGKEPDTAETDSGKINILKDIPFPLRYRELVGDYFRKVSEDYSSKHY